MSAIIIENLLSKYDLKKNYPAKELTNFHIGGACDYVVYPKSIQEIIDVISVAKQNKVPVTIIGKGTNLLVSDKGIRGVVVRLEDNFSKITMVDDNTIEAEAGASLKAVCDVSLQNSLTGVEFACGIPGGVGGAVAMNAGAYGPNMQDIVYEVTALDTDLNILTFKNEEMDFSYRHSIVNEKNLTVLKVKFKLEKGDKRVIKETIDDLMFKRTSKQPLEAYSAGSTFKRPDGYFASKLIEDSGLKGLVVGNVAVSGLHSGFLINTGSASCQEVLDLIEFVKQVVGNKFGVTLEEEVKVIGDFS